MRPTILFVNAVYPNQFSLLCEYLNATGLADALMMTSPGHQKRHQADHPELVAFQPDGPIVGPQSYYYSTKAERSARISLGLFRAIKALKSDRRIDLIVAHHTWGAPLFLFDELGIPVVSYVEFPSYRLHGWDPAYPPSEGQRLTDANMEMLTFHQILRSRLTIVPTEYAKSLIPAELQHKVQVQFEGFRIGSPPELSLAHTPRPVIGFAASGLCSAKGYQHFVRIADALARRGSDIRCVAMGDPARSPYSYEQQTVDRYFKASGKTFHDYLHEKYPASQVELLGRLPYEQFARRVAEIDIFLYPLQHGVGNWGLIELLSRGRAVIGSRRCFVPECIEDGVNGYLVDADDDAAWLARIDTLLADVTALREVQRQAYESARRFAIEAVAPRYMQLFDQALS